MLRHGILATALLVSTALPLHAQTDVQHAPIMLGIQPPAGINLMDPAVQALFTKCSSHVRMVNDLMERRAMLQYTYDELEHEEAVLYAGAFTDYSALNAAMQKVSDKVIEFTTGLDVSAKEKLQLQESVQDTMRDQVGLIDPARNPKHPLAKNMRVNVALKQLHKLLGLTEKIQEFIELSKAVWETGTATRRLLFDDRTLLYHNADMIQRENQIANDLDQKIQAARQTVNDDGCATFFPQLAEPFLSS